jgi:hypothetical protein
VSYSCKSIIVHGPQPWCHVREFLKREAPILVYPSAGSFSFQSPIKMYEYLASGLPIIAQDTHNIQQLHTDFPYFEIGNLEEKNELDALYNYIFSNPVQTISRSKSALESIRSKHLWKHRIKSVLSSLKN